MDSLRRKAGPGGKLPNLRQVVLTGHSAGAVFVLHHAMWTRAPNSAYGVRVRWLPADPRSFVYFDRRRWAYTDPEGPFVLADPTANEANASFWCQSNSSNLWPMGLERSHLGPNDLKTESETDKAEIVKRFSTRDVTLILGTNDTCNLFMRPGDGRPDPAHGWPDSVHDHVCFGSRWSGPGSGQPVPSLMTVTADFHFACDSMLQGPWRLQRGRLFLRYLREIYGRETVKVREVPGVGHVESYIFSSREYLDALLLE